MRKIELGNFTPNEATDLAAHSRYIDSTLKEATRDLNKSINELPSRAGIKWEKVPYIPPTDEEIAEDNFTRKALSADARGNTNYEFAPPARGQERIAWNPGDPDEIRATHNLARSRVNRQSWRARNMRA